MEHHDIYIYNIYIVDRAYKPTNLSGQTKGTAHRLCQVRIEVLLAKRRGFFSGAIDAPKMGF